MLKDEFIFPPSPTPYSLLMKADGRRMNLSTLSPLSPLSTLSTLLPCPLLLSPYSDPLGRSISVNEQVIIFAEVCRNL